MEQESDSTQVTEEVAWVASEYVHHKKDPLWFVVLGVVGIVLLALSYFILRDWLSTGVIILMVIAVAMTAKREPVQIEYQVNNLGVAIGEKKYGYASFRSFSLMHHDAIEHMVLEPVQKLIPPITLYFAPEDREKIVNLVSNYLPYNEQSPDFVQKISHKLRF